MRMKHLGERIPVGCLFVFGFVLSAAPRLLGGTPIADEVFETLPKYDPQIRKAAIAAREESLILRPEAIDLRPVRQKPPAAASVPSAPSPLPPPAPAPPATASPASAVIRLPSVSVTASRVNAPPGLPRLQEAVPAANVKIEPFLTDKAREEALVKKHLTVFDRLFLNRFTLPLYGTPKEARAKKAEVIEQNAKGMNEVADMMELAFQEGGDVAEYKKLKVMYEELYISRPK